VAHAQEQYGVGRVAILDFDVHHGNGGENISYCDPTRMYVSSHEAGNYACPGVEYRCDGLHGQIISCPLPPRSGSDAFRSAWRDELLPAVEAFEPEAIFVSAGFDAHRVDRLSDINLEDDDYEWVTKAVARLGGGRLPLISVLEGGYNIEQLPHSVHAHLRGLIRS
jgi:acetoin utilization deacetylase AcuC-like enzyme